MFPLQFELVLARFGGGACDVTLERLEASYHVCLKVYGNPTYERTAHERCCCHRQKSASSSKLWMA